MPPDAQDRGPQPAGRQQRYFVTVFFRGLKHPQRIVEYGMDLFEEGVRQTDEGLRVDGLLTLDEVVRLVDDGWQVLVKEPSHRRARAREGISEFEEWLADRGLS